MRYPQWSQDTRVFVDTSSLMEENAEDFFWNHIEPTLRSRGIRPLIVPKSVVEELNKLADRSQTAARARSARYIVRCLVEANVAEVIGEESDDRFSDNLLQTVFTRFRLKYPLVLITQDRGLAQDILSLNNSVSVRMNKTIEALRIGRDGRPMSWTLDANNYKGVRYRKSGPIDGSRFTASHGKKHGSVGPVRQWGSRTSQVSIDSTSKPRKFELRDRISVNSQDKTLIDTQTPGQGDVIKNTNGDFLRLVSALGSGGEGTVYETDDPAFACKIYHHDRLQNHIVEKLALMTSREICHPMVCWPTSLVYNAIGKPVGYLMSNADGKELRRSIFIKPLLLKAFPGWTRLHVVKLTSTILDAMNYLHSLNVLLGDINPANILVRDENTVFLVDCDSYQVEGFPCPVGMPPYLAPELYGLDLHSTIRTKDAEYFAIATLVFMLLHPGKPPYSHQGGEDPLRNVGTGNFPYPRGDQGARGVPDGPWRFMFSHLPRLYERCIPQSFFRQGAPVYRRMARIDSAV